MRWFILGRCDGDCRHSGRAVIFLCKAKSSLEKQKDYFDKLIHLSQPTTEKPFARVENCTLPHKVHCTCRSSAEACWGHFQQPFLLNSLAWLPMVVILNRLTELPQPLQRGQMQKHTAEARAHGCGAEVAETATCVATACSDFTQPTNRSLLLRDRPNFLFLAMERGF